MQYITVLSRDLQNKKILFDMEPYALDSKSNYFTRYVAFETDKFSILNYQLSIGNNFQNCNNLILLMYHYYNYKYIVQFCK